jgi:undecaprenyl pyrophosphate phosphatase UppP
LDTFTTDAKASTEEYKMGRVICAIFVIIGLGFALEDYTSRPLGVVSVIGAIFIVGGVLCLVIDRVAHRVVFIILVNSKMITDAINAQTTSKTTSES